MKKKIVFFTALFLVLSLALFTLCACNETKKLDREMDTEILNVYQDYDGSLMVELKNFKHDDYGGVHATSEADMEFSLDGGKTWMIWAPLSEDWCKDKGVYSIMYATRDSDYNITGFEANSYEGTVTSFKIGDSVSVCVRIPESSKYKASKHIVSDSITLKDQVLDHETISEIAINGGKLNDKEYIETFLPNYVRLEKVGTYFPYIDGESVKFGIISQIEEVEGEQKITAVKYYEDLSEAEKQGASKFEYRLVKSDDYDLEINDEALSLIRDEERYNSLYADWTVVGQDGIAYSSISQSENIWQYRADEGTSGYIDEETGEYIIQYKHYCDYTSVYLLIRVKETDNKTASAFHMIEIVLDAVKSTEPV